MARQIAGSTVVVTGASSGIGRESAKLFADNGANVVAAARREEPLRALVSEIEAAGGRAILDVTDVTDPVSVSALAQRADDTFGGIDTWVNAAATGVFGAFEDIPPDAFQRVVDVIFHGTVNSTRAAMPYLRKREGVLVNVGSTIGKAPVPFMSAYDAAKAAVLSFSETLRLEEETHGVAVCMVEPPPTDTPFYRHAANYTGHPARPPHPVYPASATAKAILACARKPRREINVGAASKLQQLGLAVAPGPYEAVTTPYVAHGMFDQEKSVEATDGSLYAPMAEGVSASGGYGDDGAALRAGRRLALAGATAVVAASAWRVLRRPRSGNGRAHEGPGPYPVESEVPAPDPHRRDF